MVENSMVKLAEIALLFFSLIRIAFRHTFAMIVVNILFSALTHIVA